MNENIKVGGDIHAGDGGYSIGTKEKYDEFVKNRNRMNERIRQLIEQATDTIEIVNPDTGITHYREFFDKEKFAELIVRECMKLNSKELSITAIERLLPLYEEHFGVEE